MNRPPVTSPSVMLFSRPASSAALVWASGGVSAVRSSAVSFLLATFLYTRATADSVEVILGTRRVVKKPEHVRSSVVPEPIFSLEPGFLLLVWHT